MAANAILTIAWLVLAHLVADFVVQTTSVVRDKNASGPRAWRGLAIHAFGVGVVLVPAVLAFGLQGLWLLVATVLTHVVIDRAKVLATRGAEARALGDAHARHEPPPPAAGLGRAWTPLPGAYFIADQLAHLAVLVVAWAVWLSAAPLTAGWSDAVDALFGSLDDDPTLFHSSVLAIVVVACLLIANIRAGALFVATLVRPFEVMTGSDDRLSAVSIAQAAPAPAAGEEPAATATLPASAATPAAVQAPAAEPLKSRWSFRIGPVEGQVEAEPPPAPVPKADIPPVPPPSQVGATIGVLERLLIVVFVVISAEAAVGFVIAAKTIARFRLLDDRDFAEYYLLGTLGSVSVAIFTGLLAKAALGLSQPRSRRSDRGRQPRQPVRGSPERLEPLREREPQLRPPKFRSREER